jgi:DNA-binding NtrC family response regulator
LENIIERAVILARGEVLTLQDLPVFVKQQNGSDSDLDVVLNENEGQLTLPEILALTEKRVIMKALEKHQHNQSKAAKALGISESGLRYKIQSLQIPKD